MNEKFDNWYIFGINLEMSLLLKCEEYHGLCAQKWNGKITAIMNFPELSTLYSQNKEPCKFSHWSSRTLLAWSIETVMHMEDTHDEYLTWKAERGKIVWKLEN